VTIWDKHEVVFVNVITNTIMITVDIGRECWGTNYNLNRLASRVMQPPTSSHIVYLDPNGKLIARVSMFSCGISA
jgi:hypothetical protein